MRISKWISPLCFLCVVCLLNVFLSFLAEPADGASEAMWSAYSKEDNIDTIFVGASVCAASFDPTIINEELGVNAFNMGTPSQSMAQSVRALEIVLKEHEVETVILGTGFFGLQEAAIDEAELTFEKAYARQAGGVKGAIESLKYVLSEATIKKEKSINYFFPWIYNHITISREEICKNVSAKVTPVEETFDADTAERRQWRLEKGYAPYTGMVDYTSAWEQNSALYYSPALYPPCVAEFKKLMELCNRYDVDLMVVNVPHPAYDVVASYDSYAATEEAVKELCREYDVDYYNFSLAKEEIFRSEPEYYYDFEHLNYQGSQAFSEAFAKFMKRRANGENMKDDFYSVEEYYKIHASLVEEWKELMNP